MTRHTTWSHAAAYSLVALLGVIGAAVPASAQTTALVIQSEPGDYVGQGQTITYTDSQATFTVSRNAFNGASVRLSGSGIDASLDFSSSIGTLVPGYYQNARKYGTTTFVGLAVVVNNRSCVQVTGRYLVREAEYALNGDIVRLAIDLEHHCSVLNDALFAAIRYNSTVPTDIFPGSTARYSLTVSPAAHGFVGGAGLACGGGQSVCSITLAAPAWVIIGVIPDPGYIFTGWAGACSGASLIRVLVNSVQECRATFDTSPPTTARTLLTITLPNGAFGFRSGQTDIFNLEGQWRVIPVGNGVWVEVRGVGPYSDAQWRLEFNAPVGQTLQTGSYTATTQPTSAHMFVSGNDGWNEGWWCPSQFGPFVVRQLERDPQTGDTTAFAADFQASCDWGGGLITPPFIGTVNYRATYEVVPPAPPPPPPTPPSPVPAPPTGCATPDPFTALGGGTCHNGGWLPPGMPVPGNPPTPPPAGCTTPDPFVSLGGGTCRNGGWLPPGMH
jgi:hypothetical protein